MDYMHFNVFVLKSRNIYMQYLIKKIYQLVALNWENLNIISR